MATVPIPSNYVLCPGHVCLPARPVRLAAVVSSGVAVTVFDTRRICGGMSHYALPRRQGGRSTAIFAAPALVSLADLFLSGGSSPADLEAHLYGGASWQASQRYVHGVSEENVAVGIEILERLGIAIVGQDVGGVRGRKVVFNTGTGEALVAKVDRLREEDWYPDAAFLSGGRQRGCP